jgi:hypothetical protein
VTRRESPASIGSQSGRNSKSDCDWAVSTAHIQFAAHLTLELQPRLMGYLELRRNRFACYRSSSNFPNALFTDVDPNESRVSLHAQFFPKKISFRAGKRNPHCDPLVASQTFQKKQTF